MSTNVPITRWRKTSGLGEYSYAGVEEIVDNTGVNLVDKNGVDVVDTGVLFTNIPQTEWEEDDSL